MSPKLPKPPSMAEIAADKATRSIRATTRRRRCATAEQGVPTHWSFLLGEIALYSFIVLLITGVWLTLFFDPSMVDVTYDGVYQPLRGVEMSRAYASTLDISFEVRAACSSARSTTGRRCCSPRRSWCTWPASSSPARSAARARPTG